MTFKEIYDKTAQFWPPEIDISDGKEIVPPDWGKFNNLSSIWNFMEERTNFESELIQLMVWAIFCAFHKKAIKNFHDGFTKVYLTELDMGYIKHKFEESLFHTEFDYYSDLRKEYKSE